MAGRKTPLSQRERLGEGESRSAVNAYRKQSTVSQRIEKTDKRIRPTD